jgi:bifunctional UDP-N-acetylglucosamine pyrophosphorylase/glucosamine-1-phosphate N-acetyltransferase
LNCYFYYNIILKVIRFTEEFHKEVFYLNSIGAVILAAGEGTRMKSKHPKVSHSLLGKPMVQHVIDSVRSAGIDEIVVVVGHKAEEVKQCICTDVKYALQEKQLGTGHAVICASHYIENNGITLVLTGDTPLISADTLLSLISYHKDKGYSGTILTAEFEDPTGYGRIIRDDSGNVLKIVEHKDASEDEKRVREINSSMYCFDTVKLLEALKSIKNHNAQGEYYLTDVIEIMKGNGLLVGAYKANDVSEVLGVNSRMQRADCARAIRQKVLNRLMSEGVTIIDPGSTYIDRDVLIGRDTVIYPGTVLEGNTSIAEDCIIGPNSRLVDAIVHDSVEIMNSVVLKSEIKSNTHVGPFAYIRPESIIGENAKIGDFVEIKKSKIGNYTKVPHLTYVGDAEVGENVNLGCGTITVNYDGKIKHKTEIGDNVFVGCNTNLVAPVKVNKDSYIAAGSTITDEVPAGSLAIARGRQVNKEGWVEKKDMHRKRK